jgi:elongator complex protein 2
MVCGCDDSKLHCYIQHETDFIEVLTLDGHGDWIRGVDIAITDKGSLMLSSCSQDAVIRLWSIIKCSDGKSNGEEDEHSEQAQIPELQTRQNIFAVDKLISYSIQLESVLLGHEDWIYSVCWHPPTFEGETRHQPMCLLSASMDKTMIIWKLDKSAGIWVDKVRVGDVGGNTLGFYGAVFSEDGKSILGHDYQGALHLWSMTGVSQQAVLSENCQMNELWEREVIISGHFGPVESISWSPGNPGYLLSTSHDQTTRLHGPWKRDDEVTWHEVARPQIHGYDMQFVVSLSSQQFVSAGDEKVSI